MREIQYTFSTLLERDSWLKTHYPSRTASDTPGFYYCDGAFNIGVYALTVTEYPKDLGELLPRKVPK